MTALNGGPAGGRGGWRDAATDSRAACPSGATSLEEAGLAAGAVCLPCLHNIAAAAGLVTRRFGVVLRAWKEPGRRVSRRWKPIPGVVSVILAIRLVAPPAISAAHAAPPDAQIIRTFDVQPNIVMCYDRAPKFIYVVNRKVGTTLEQMSFDGVSSIVAGFPRPLNELSLSCSEDGSLIAVVDSSSSLYLVKNGVMSEYRFEAPVLGALRSHGLLAEDGRTIALPERPAHVSGPDILKDMHVFVGQNDGDTFVLPDKVYVHRPGQRSIDVYEYREGAWRPSGSVTVPETVNFLASVTRCSGRDVVTLTEYDAYLYYDVTVKRIDRNDWLKQIGFRRELQRRRFGKAQIHSGRFGHCAWSVRNERIVPSPLTALIVADESGIRVYRIKEQLTDTVAEIEFTKDGCQCCCMRPRRGRRS